MSRVGSVLHASETGVLSASHRIARVVAERRLSVVARAMYHHAGFGCLECMGCRELIEVPHEAVLKNGQPPVPIKSNPENLMLWRELMELDHEKCSSFKDARMAQQARQYRKN